MASIHTKNAAVIGLGAALAIVATRKFNNIPVTDPMARFYESKENNLHEKFAEFNPYFKSNSSGVKLQQYADSSDPYPKRQKKPFWT